MNDNIYKHAAWSMKQSLTDNIPQSLSFFLLCDPSPCSALLSTSHKNLPQRLLSSTQKVSLDHLGSVHKHVQARVYALL